MPQNLSRTRGTLATAAGITELTDAQWALVEDFFDPLGRQGRPARYDRREIVNALLFLARTGCQWRYLPDRYPPWPAVWQQWRRWRDGNRQVWRRAMALLGAEVRPHHGRQATPSMLMIDGQTVRGGGPGRPSTTPAAAEEGRLARSGRSSSRSWGCPSRLAWIQPNRTTFGWGRVAR